MPQGGEQDAGSRWYWVKFEAADQHKAWGEKYNEWVDHMRLLPRVVEDEVKPPHPMSKERQWREESCAQKEGEGKLEEDNDAEKDMSEKAKEDDEDEAVEVGWPSDEEGEAPAAAKDTTKRRVCATGSTSDTSRSKGAVKITTKRARATCVPSEAGGGKKLKLQARESKPNTQPVARFKLNSPAARAAARAELEADVICEVCRSGHDEDCMILCDNCEDGYHTFCLPGGKRGDEVPTGSWECPECDEPQSAKPDVSRGHSKSKSKSLVDKTATPQGGRFPCWVKQKGRPTETALRKKFLARSQCHVCKKCFLFYGPLKIHAMSSKCSGKYGEWIDWEG